MHRFHMPLAAGAGERFDLSPAEAHHAWRVLRLAGGESVTVLDGAGVELVCVVEAVRRGEVKLRVVQRIRHERPTHRMTLVQSLIKGRGMDWLLQKATELGVARIVPVVTERSVVRLDAAEGAERREKWEAVAVEAIKQCGSPWLPKIEVPITIDAYLKTGDRNELELAGSLQPDAPHPRRHFEAFVKEHGRLPRSVSVWVGPEGDFTPDELDRIGGRGVRPATFGRLVLRSDTAAVYAISIVQYELGSPEHLWPRVGP
jgi:16S rRNA (uracil1498-N3)-methyltransferase